MEEYITYLRKCICTNNTLLLDNADGYIDTYSAMFEIWKVLLNSKGSLLRWILWESGYYITIPGSLTGQSKIQLFNVYIDILGSHILRSPPSHTDDDNDNVTTIKNHHHLLHHHHQQQQQQDHHHHFYYYKSNKRKLLLQ